MSCPACNGQEGAAHTCPGSGSFRAEEAYGAGAVVDVLELDRFAVRLELMVRAIGEPQAREHLVRLAEDLLNDDLVDWVDFTIEQR